MLRILFVVAILGCRRLYFCTASHVYIMPTAKPAQFACVYVEDMDDI